MEIKINMQPHIAELLGFKFEWNQVSFLWKTLEPSIASGVFLLYNRLKEIEAKKDRYRDKKKNIQIEYDNCRDRVSEQREYLRGLIRKVEYLEIQNKALIEYVKVLKKK